MVEGKFGPSIAAVVRASVGPSIAAVVVAASVMSSRAVSVGCYTAPNIPPAVVAAALLSLGAEGAHMAGPEVRGPLAVVPEAGVDVVVPSDAPAPSPELGPAPPAEPCVAPPRLARERPFSQLVSSSRGESASE